MIRVLRQLAVGAATIESDYLWHEFNVHSIPASRNKWAGRIPSILGLRSRKYLAWPAFATGNGGTS